MNILFVCKFNRFRSRVAAAYFNKINKNKKIKARSAGLIRGSPLDKLQIQTAKSLGINIKGKPLGISTKLLKWQDAIILVSDDVPPALFADNKKYGKKLIVWKIPDTQINNKKVVLKIIKSITNKIDKLVKGAK